MPTFTYEYSDDAAAGLNAYIAQKQGQRLDVPKDIDGLLTSWLDERVAPLERKVRETVLSAVTANYVKLTPEGRAAVDAVLDSELAKMPVAIGVKG